MRGHMALGATHVDFSQPSPQTGYHNFIGGRFASERETLRELARDGQKPETHGHRLLRFSRCARNDLRYTAR